MPDDHSYTDDDTDRIGNDDEVYDEAYDDDVYDDDVYDDEIRDDTYADDDVVGREEYVDDVYEDDDYDDDTEYDRDVYAEDDDNGWWDETVIGLILVSGVLLFLFPEPITSTLGMALIAIGVLAWAADALA